MSAPAGRFHLDRRAVLRGGAAGGMAAVTIPLPRMGGMLNGNGTAYADGAPLPRRFVVWFFGNGILIPRWVPDAAGTGDAWQLSEQLQPLAAVKSHLAVVTGLRYWFPSYNQASSHHLATANNLTGATLFSKDNFTVTLPSIDQIIARAPAMQGAPFRSLELGLSGGGAPMTASIMKVVSHAGVDAPNWPELNPRSAFTRLFGGTTRGSGRSALAPEARALEDADRKSALDLIAEDARQMKARLGAEDRMRLDAHLEGIRALERQIDALAQSPPGACPATPAAADYPDTVAAETMETIEGQAYRVGQASPELDEAMANLIVLALACDRTRVLSYMFTSPGSQVIYRHLGLEESFHSICHNEPGDQPSVHKGVMYAMTRLGRFLEKLKNTDEGSGNLLDNCCVYTTSCIGVGKSHADHEMPALIAGKAGGALKGNVHFHSESGEENISKVLFTLANVMGVPVTSYGLEGARVTDGIGAVVA